MRINVFNVKVALIAAALFFCSSVVRLTAQTLMQAVQLIGLTGLNQNTKGKLTVTNGTLRFIHSKGNADVAATAIENVVTGTDSQRAIGGTLGTLTQLAPFGSGRVLSLFRAKLDTLTIQYRDADGGLHGVIFTVPLGKAEMIKQEIVAQGAHTSIPTQPDPEKQGPTPGVETMRLILETDSFMYCSRAFLVAPLARERTSAGDASVGNPGDDDPGRWDIATRGIPGVPL